MCVKYELDKRAPLFLPDHVMDLPYGITFLSLRLVKSVSHPRVFETGNPFRDSAVYAYTLPRVHYARVYCVHHSLEWLTSDY